MSDRRPSDPPKDGCSLNPHESLVRGFLRNVNGLPYTPLRTLGEAQGVEDGVVVFEGDWGGQIFVVAQASVISCDESTLHQLLLDLDERACPEDDGDGTALCFERAAVGSGIAGGMGGGRGTDDVWVHRELVQAGEEPGIRAVLAGRLLRLPIANPDVEPDLRARILRAYHERLPASGIHFGRGWPDGWSSVHRDELDRRKDAEIPPRPDGQRWYGATIRNVVRHAGFEPWVRRSQNRRGS